MEELEVSGELNCKQIGSVFLLALFRLPGWLSLLPIQSLCRSWDSAPSDTLGVLKTWADYWLFPGIFSDSWINTASDNIIGSIQLQIILPDLTHAPGLLMCLKQWALISSWEVKGRESLRSKLVDFSIGIYFFLHFIGRSLLGFQHFCWAHRLQPIRLRRFRQIDIHAGDVQTASLNSMHIFTTSYTSHEGWSCTEYSPNFMHEQLGGQDSSFA